VREMWFWGGAISEEGEGRGGIEGNFVNTWLLLLPVEADGRMSRRTRR